ncbi:MAG: M23 family metallopeptidase [Dysgonomonas sp.]
MRKFIIFLFYISSFNHIIAQDLYRSPLDIPIVLSANFGELRPNHFHSGIDLKTAGVINKPVYSIADGYISRISVSPAGYGLAIYVTHTETGQTSVYGHLNKYASKVAEYVRTKQYEQESFSVDLKVDKDLLPVKKGDLIAYSGNTGSSGGPHVHFEIRNTESQIAIDPLAYYKDKIRDTQAPQIKGIAVYPVNEKGAADFSRDPARRKISVLKGGSYAPIKDTVEVWGVIGFGVYTNDRMNGTANIYGVKKVRLYCDDIEIYSSDITDVNFGTTRMINSLIDYEYWVKKRVFYQKMFVEPGNKLQIYKVVNNGYVDIKEERVYNLRCELDDLYGNQTIYNFSVKGREQTIPQKKRCTQQMRWDLDNNFTAGRFSLSIPKSYLYDDLCFIFKNKPSEKYLSDIYHVNDVYVPLHNYSEMSIPLERDTVDNKSQYGVVRIDGARESWIGGTYENGVIKTRIRDLGHSYAVGLDTEAPVITPVQPIRWLKNAEIKIKLSDNKSGIHSYKGTIDGNYVLFENDVKTSVYSYKFDAKRLQKGQNHKLIFTAVDRAGNTSNYEYVFKY